MHWRIRSSMLITLGLGVSLACSDDAGTSASEATATETSSSGDGDGDSATGDGDGDSATGDGDGDSATGDGDGDTTDSATGDGDGDTTGDDGMCAGPCGSPNCGDCPGPAWVDVGGYSVSETEVNNDQYGAFLDVVFSPNYDPAPPTCAWKQSFEPDQWPSDNPQLPVVFVDWCDAMAYCSWAGGHLCGAVGGGEVPVEDSSDPNDNEWHRACTNVGLTEYPYGLLYQPQACNTSDAGIGELIEVGSLDTCEGGAPGIFDMSGNVWEWTNSCEAEGVGDEQQRCVRRGGGYFSDGPDSTCSGPSLRARNERTSSMGFRCCM